MRYVRWVKDDDPRSAINNKPELTQENRTAAHNRWIAYNRMRGQHSSAMEHATPEQFWVDKTQCRYVDENGQTKNPTLSDCGQAVSTVKALAIAQQQGQKIYTITPQNASTVLAKLPVSGSVSQEIRNAVQAGKEVTVHEKSVSAYGWTGYGYSIIDPETGAGGYIIEEGGNGGEFRPNNDLPIASMILCVAAMIAGALAASGGFVVMLVFLSIVASLTQLHLLYLGALERAKCDSAITCIQAIFILGAAVEIAVGAVGLIAAEMKMNFQSGGTLLAVGGIISIMGGSNISSLESRCNTFCREPIP
jgi:hypothetical protein